ncbi:16S rRNA methyltransferase [Intrasporangium chromatireducens Q5-1]|uniref:16S rRNA methyltransferase n=1 Tax=Intrasporangium chromatireducens Q5-1 TaxID=584657 RepID=W9GK46_9MICO|nr:methyltransferase [Intrasporangium chromatireducens]EWT05487.1 16S rRNA methyltransferase [Intrasporangium chromatireducens Q5-1]
MSEQPDHYFSREPATPEERRQVHVTLDGRDLTLTTANGVYSPDRLDPGTAVLLRGAPHPSPSGDLLDIGCGWGPIALTLALRSPQARVWGVDVNRRALDLARLNAAAAGLHNLTFCEPEDVPAEVRFETIWSNPPIHVGKPALHALLEQWLPRLSPDGRAHLVVQKHLGSDSLQKWINAQDWALTCSRLSSSKAFRILEIRHS